MSESTLRRLVVESQTGAEQRIPKYLRMATVLQSMIDQGHWKPGDQLPAETEIARQLDVSLGTVQKTLGLLAERGAIVREHGRGTFVTGNETPQQDLWYFRFLADDGISLLPIYSQALERSVVSAQGPWSAFLAKEDQFVRIRRLISVNHEFEFYNEVYFSAERFGPVAALPLESLHGVVIYRILGEQFGAPTQRVAQTMKCASFPIEVCADLRLENGSVGLVWEILAYAARSEPLVYQRAFVPQNPRRLYVSEMTGARNCVTLQTPVFPRPAG